MLSMHNVQSAQQAASYFSKDDYYLGHEVREPSAWWGRGAEALGLRGTVEPDRFFALLQGVLPNGHALPGADIAGAAEAKRRRAGLDLTFSAPKSVSLLALVAEHTAVAQAHEAAVDAALGYLQEHAAQVRTTQDGKTRFETTDNLVVAKFSHDTSRKLDPQLHTHCVALNMTRRSDGAWRALANEEIYRSKMAAGLVYRSELAKRLRQLGYAIERTHADGRFEVKGFTAEQLAHFSQRRAAIEMRMEGSHVRDARAAARATLLTRDTKRSIRREDLGAAWAARAQAAGIEPRRAVPHPPRAVPSDAPSAARRALDFAVAHITERAVGFEVRDLLRHALPLGLGDITLADLQPLIRRDAMVGRLVHAEAAGPDGQLRYTTPEALAVELNLAEKMRAAQQSARAIMAEDSEASLAPHLEGLTAGQQDAARLVLTTQDRVVGVQGYAGTGKSTLLGRVRQAAEAQGFAVRGFAPSASAAGVLQEQSDIPSQTIASHLLAPSPPPDKPQLWVVDEVSMLGNREALRLLRAAEKAQARVVFLGDRHQLPSIEAGKVFSLLMSQGMQTAHMKEIVRQKDPTLRQAVKHTIERRPQAALEALQSQVIEIEDDAKRLRAVARHFLERPAAEREGTLLVTPARADAQAITAHIRTGLREAGVLVGAEVQAEILLSADLTRPQVREAASYQVGDRVRFGRAYKRLGCASGEVWRVEAIETSTNNIALAHEDGRQIRWLPHRMDKVEVYRGAMRPLCEGDTIRWTRNDRRRGWVNGESGVVCSIDSQAMTAKVSCGRSVSRQIDLKRDPHWDHGYVCTVHAAQGQTRDHAMVHVDTRRQRLTGFESWYVALSRARRSVVVYTDSRAELPQTIERSMQKESALELARGGR